MLTRAQVAAFEKAIAIANHMLPKLEMLERIGRVHEPLAQRISEIRKKRDYLFALSETALEFHSQVGQSGGNDRDIPRR